MVLSPKIAPGGVASLTRDSYLTPLLPYGFQLLQALLWLSPVVLRVVLVPGANSPRRFRSLEPRGAPSNPHFLPRCTVAQRLPWCC